MLGTQSKHPGKPKPAGALILQARCLSAEREHFHYTRVSRAVTDLQGGENGELNRGEVIRPQTGSNVPSVQENPVQPAERNAGEHVTLGPHVLVGVKEWIRAHGNYVMEGFNGFGGDGAERNHQAQA